MKNATLIIMFGLLGGMRLSAKPNILFIMSDDHVHSAIGAYGSRLAGLDPTPNLDTLASEGMLLQSVFCQNSICSPSRASIMTGQSSATNGVRVLADHENTLPANMQYLAIEMKNAGYTTAVIGKWHLNDLPSSTAFDYYLTLPGQGDYWNPRFNEKGTSGQVQFSGHSTKVITDRALNWLQNRDVSKPFFLMLHYKAPHDVFQYDSTNPVVNSYLNDVTVPEPASLYDDGNHGGIGSKGYNNELHKVLGSSVGLRNFNRNFVWEYNTPIGSNDDETKANAYQEYMKMYLRCVKGIDENVVRVFNYLQTEGSYDNTLVTYTGDQGFWLGEHDFYDKRWAYEESLRMPLIVRYPVTIAGGSTSDAIIENVDFAPTLLDFAGVTTPSYMQGRSFKSILETGTEPVDWKQEAYYHYWYQLEHLWVPAHIAIRTKDYKLIMFYGTHEDENEPQTPVGWELYDMKNDPYEMNNLYGDPVYSNIIRYLKERLAALRTYYGEDDVASSHKQVINDYWDYDISDYHNAVNTSLDFYHVYYPPEVGENAPITWSYLVLTSGASEVSTDGTLLEALNFSSGSTPSDYNTTINGVAFQGFTNGHGGTEFVGPNATYLSANSRNVVPNAADHYSTASGGLAVYDVLNSRFIWDGLNTNNRIVLSGLTVGNGYSMQLFFGDTRNGEAGASITVDDEKGNTLNSPAFGSNGAVGFVINGEFTAVSDQQLVTVNRNGEGMHLNGYQLRQISTGGGGSPEGADTVPKDPRGLACIASDSQVFLDWIDSPETDIDHYIIYRGLTDGSMTAINTTTAGDYTDTTVMNGTRYYYAVSAVDSGAQESGLSNQVLAISHSSGDIDRNGSVDLYDMSYVSQQWLTNGLCIPSADVDTSDGTFKVDINDLGLIVNSWLDQKEK